MSSKDLNELNSIKYKSNLKCYNNISISKIEEELNNLDQFLEEEKKLNVQDSWGKMDKNQKIEKLMEFSILYKEEHQLSEEDYQKLVTFFQDCIEKKRIHKTKDIVYDKKTGLIKNIPGLMLNKQNNFTIKNMDSKSGALRCLQTKKTCKKAVSENMNQ